MSADPTVKKVRKVRRRLRAAASLIEKLPLQSGDRQRNAAAGLNRDVLEQKRLAVRAMQPLEHFGAPRRRRGLTSAREVVGKPHDAIRS